MSLQRAFAELRKATGLDDTASIVRCYVDNEEKNYVLYKCAGQSSRRACCSVWPKEL